jgi:hypothetical protein
MWGRAARSRCVRFEPDDWGGRVVGEHDGYRWLADPVTHRREVYLDGRGREVVVRDEIIGDGVHEAAAYFHLTEHANVMQTELNGYLVDLGIGQATIVMDPGLTVSCLVGSDAPAGGWVSRGYHRKAAGTTLVGRCSCRGSATFVSRVVIGER